MKCNVVVEMEGLYSEDIGLGRDSSRLLGYRHNPIGLMPLYIVPLLWLPTLGLSIIWGWLQYRLKGMLWKKGCDY